GVERLAAVRVRPPQIDVANAQRAGRDAAVDAQRDLLAADRERRALGARTKRQARLDDAVASFDARRNACILHRSAPLQRDRAPRRGTSAPGAARKRQRYHHSDASVRSGVDDNDHPIALAAAPGTTAPAHATEAPSSPGAFAAPASTRAISQPSSAVRSCARAI